VAADSEYFVILASTVLIQSQSVTNRQTNTDRGVARYQQSWSRNWGGVKAKLGACALPARS